MLVHIIMIVVDYLIKQIDSNGLQILWSEELQRLATKTIEKCMIVAVSFLVFIDVILFVFGGTKYPSRVCHSARVDLLGDEKYSCVAEDKLR